MTETKFALRVRNTKRNQSLFLHSVYPNSSESTPLSQINEVQQITITSPTDSDDNTNETTTTMHTRLQNGHSNSNSRNNSLAHMNTHHSNSSTGLNKIPESQALVARRPSILLQEILSTRRPSAIMHALTRPSNHHHPSMTPNNRSMLFMDSFHEGGSSRSINIVTPPNGRDRNELASMAKKKNRRVGDDALTASLSALYAKLIVILGCAMPITEILSTRIPTGIYQGFYIYLYAGSIAFVLFTYATHMKSRAVSSLIKSYRK
jgi:hypothetical protein